MGKEQQQHRLTPAMLTAFKRGRADKAAKLPMCDADLPDGAQVDAYASGYGWPAKEGHEASAQALLEALEDAAADEAEAATQEWYEDGERAIELLADEAADHVPAHLLTIAPPEHREDRYCAHRLQYDRERNHELGGDA